ncbi:MAG: carboxypeptidase-like regulatory domain-containing protein [Chloroflexota bacterium]
MKTMKPYHAFFIAGIILLILAVMVACQSVTPLPLPTPSVIPSRTPLSSPILPTITPSLTSTPEGPSLHGVVVDVNNLPVAGATVRVQVTENKTVSATDGTFTLYGLTAETPIVITAWSAGYYVGWVENVLPDTEPVTITLKPYYTTDNPDYTWFSHEGALGSLSCSHCMPSYNEWIHNAHSQSAVNPRFLTMYNGTDVNGRQSPLTRYGFNRDYGRFPLRPDPNQPYYGPGYKLDFPETAGNCASCHIPAMTAKPGMAYAADPNMAAGIELEGIFCEFCHKIGEVTLDPTTGLPYSNMPGTLSMCLYRPGPDQQLFFGNFDDVTRRVSYNPLYEQSQYCAPCHFGTFWDVTIYNSFGEWLESPYSDPQTGKTCQNCHMPPVDYNYFVFPEQGGLNRDSNRIFSHLMPGASSTDLLQNAVTMSVSASRAGEEITVIVTIVNDQTGHHIPTDSPLRQMILLVSATDGLGQALPLIDGPTVSDYGGVGDPAEGYYAGLPGKIYAKTLMELWTEVTPTGAYWNPTRIVSDNRLAAFESDTSMYVFQTSEVSKTSEVSVRVTLLFRRAFKQLMDQKGWDVPDILMDEIRLELTGS